MNQNSEERSLHFHSPRSIFQYMSGMQSESGLNPYVTVVANKQRNLNKKLQKIHKIEDQIASGNGIDNDQKILCDSKPRIEASLADLAGIRAALEEVARKEAENEKKIQEETEKKKKNQEDETGNEKEKLHQEEGQLSQPEVSAIPAAGCNGPDLMQRQNIVYLMQIGAYEAEAVPDIVNFLQNDGHIAADEPAPSFALRPDWSIPRICNFLHYIDDRPAPTTQEEALTAELAEKQVMEGVARGAVPIGLVPHLLKGHGVNPALPVTQK